MANYISSLLLAYQGKIAQQLNAAEIREIEVPILDSALKSAPLALGVDAQAIRDSTKRSVYTYGFNKFNPSVVGARALAPTGAQGDSNQTTLSWATYAVTGELFAQTGMDNKFSPQEMLNNQVSQMQRALRENIGLNIVANLHNSRSQVSRAVLDGRSASSILGTDVQWDGVNCCYTIASNKASTFFQAASNVMKQNYYYGSLRAIADPLTFNNATFLQNQGVGNAVNYDFQFADYLPGKDGIMMHPQLGTTVSELGIATGGTAIVMPTGGIEAYCIVPWIPLRNRRGDGDMDSFNGGYGTIMDDKGYDLTYAVRGWAQKADGSGAGSVLQDTVNYLELSVDIAFVVGPMPTNAGESAIIEFVGI